MKAYKSLVKYALANNCTVSVFDGEEWAQKRGTGYNSIIADIESVEEAQIVIRNSEGDKMGWALILTGLDDDETVADYSISDFMQGWELSLN
jgi:hypothetical protein